jgi:ATP-dependent DNA helicase RecQ
LSKAFTPPAGLCFVSARVASVLVWCRDEVDPGYQALARCDRWEVVLPELVFGPMHATS